MATFETNKEYSFDRGQVWRIFHSSTTPAYPGLVSLMHKGDSDSESPSTIFFKTGTTFKELFHLIFKDTDLSKVSLEYFEDSNNGIVTFYDGYRGYYITVLDSRKRRSIGVKLGYMLYLQQHNLTDSYETVKSFLISLGLGRDDIPSMMVYLGGYNPDALTH